MQINSHNVTFEYIHGTMSLSSISMSPRDFNWELLSFFGCKKVFEFLTHNIDSSDESHSFILSKSNSVFEEFDIL